MLPSRTIRWLSLAGAVAPVVLALAQAPQTTFRSGVDLIAVDVDVVDRNGGPVAGLRPDQFNVLIDGKTRKVISADFIRVETRPSSPRPPDALVAGSAGAEHAAPDGQQGRVFILAFDVMSFQALATAPARDAARAFVERLQPTDLVGLIAFPMGPTVDVTTDRPPLFKEVDRIVGSASSRDVDAYRFTPSEIVDLTYLYAKGDARTLGARVREVCAFTPDPEMCQMGTPPLVVQDAATRAQFEEMEISVRLGALQAMFKSLATSPRRKVVVLISAGILVTDRPGGRPDPGDIGRLVGQGASEANCVVYALHFDRLLVDRASASRQGSNRRSDVMRDAAMFAKPLDQIAGTSGGALFTVAQGGGEFAFDRILTETSAYYLLGVEPTEKDRDGRAHQLHVRVPQKEVTVRGRSWVTLPKVNAGASGNPGAPLASGGAGVGPGLAAPAPRPLPESVRDVADAYGRRDYASVGQLLSRTTDLANLLRDLRGADPPWPDTPHRARVFSLELALAGLSSANGFARDEGLKLLTYTHVLMEQARGADAFACSWFRVEAAALAGLWRPGLSLPFVDRARRRCAGDARLSLARAVILEQQSRTEPGAVRTGDVIAAYLDVDQNAEAAGEARVRAAWFSLRRGDIDRAVDLLPASAGSLSDPDVRYMYGVVRGQVLQARGQLDEAIAAFRQALDASPGAQSARVALMALLLGRGEGDEAAALAEAIQTAGNDQRDPWWMYSRGDFRAYPAILARLRELAP